MPALICVTLGMTMQLILLSTVAAGIGARP